ncbi:GDSL-type esterase/lipase family protein [uncultured Microbacterium sp.]|uniref:GDSL-type esterase/lipase family protein n=1 Tax=uncultured Microbacterium sp. TaxID=191216 RepID=UPI00260F3995|nr:GDSL-type esterase/lipase family protein [uncultured Microbacterium sp.]
MKRWMSAALAAVMMMGAVALSTAAAAPAQETVQITPGAYSLSASPSHAQLDIAGISTSAGARAITSAERGSAAQSWWFAQVSPGVHRISNVNSGLCLQDAAATGGALTQQSCTGDDDQLWQVVADGTGFQVQNRASGRMLTASATGVVSATTTGDADQRWVIAPHRLARVAAWGTSLTAGGPAFSDQTVRMVVRPTVTGNAQRLTFSNRFGSAPLTIGAASVAPQAMGLSTTGTPAAVRFGGSTSVTIPVGAEVISDPVNVAISPDRNLIVSVYVQGDVPTSTFHSMAFTSNGIAAGDQASSSSEAPFTTTSTSFFFLKSIDVISATASGTTVTLGDSITDGFGSTRDGFTSWPAQLAQRLHADGAQRGIVNAGISSNRVTIDSTSATLARGMSAVERFDYDVASVPGVTTVVLFEGINDVGDGVSAPQLIAGYESLVQQARDAGLQVIGATMTPFNGVGSYTAERESVRTTANEWMLSSPLYDDVLDFSAAVADPADATRLLPANDSGDRIHLSSEGYRVLAEVMREALD